MKNQTPDSPPPSLFAGLMDFLGVFVVFFICSTAGCTITMAAKDSGRPEDFDSGFRGMIGGFVSGIIGGAFYGIRMTRRRTPPVPRDETSSPETRELP